MSNIDKRALREAAERAESDSWGYDRDEFNEALTPSTLLALLNELEAAKRQNGYLREQRDEWERKAISNFEDCSEMAARIEELESQRQMAFMAGNRWADKFREAEKRIADLPGQKRLIGWRMADYTDETEDPALAKNWATAVDVLPIFEGDVNTKLSSAAAGKGE